MTRRSYSPRATATCAVEVLADADRSARRADRIEAALRVARAHPRPHRRLVAALERRRA